MGKLATLYLQQADQFLETACRETVPEYQEYWLLMAETSEHKANTLAEKE